MKLIWTVWLIVISTFGPLFANVVSASVSKHFPPILLSTAYDVRVQPRTTYDAALVSAFDYDCGPIPLAEEKQNCSQGTGALFGEFAKLFAAEGTALREGSFSIADWSGYPANVPKPTGPFNLLEGAEYDAARAEANAANRAMHQADPSLNGLQLHEIQPVKFGGSPTDPLNKIPLTPQQHAPVTTWWNQLQRNITP